MVNHEKYVCYDIVTPSCCDYNLLWAILLQCLDVPIPCCLLSVYHSLSYQHSLLYAGIKNKGLCVSMRMRLDACGILRILPRTVCDCVIYKILFHHSEKVLIYTGITFWRNRNCLFFPFRDLLHIIIAIYFFGIERKQTYYKQHHHQTQPRRSHD